MTEELTGILQSRGQEEGVSYVVIDSTRLNVPEYVLDWMANMNNPLRNGETVLYKKQQDKEGAWRLTKIRRPPKAGNTPTGPETALDQKSGILISHHATGCTIRMANGDRVYALPSRFPEVDLPQKIQFSVDKKGFIRQYKFQGKVYPEGFTPANEIPKDNINRLEEEAKAKEKEKPDTARPTPSPLPAPENARITIAHTINLGNYESLKVGIEGQSEDREKLNLILDDMLAQYGRNHPPTREAIDIYRRRVLGSAGE